MPCHPCHHRRHHRRQLLATMAAKRKETPCSTIPHPEHMSTGLSFFLSRCAPGEFSNSLAVVVMHGTTKGESHIKTVVEEGYSQLQLISLSLFQDYGGLRSIYIDNPQSLISPYALIIASWSPSLILQSLACSAFPKASQALPAVSLTSLACNKPCSKP